MSAWRRCIFFVLVLASSLLPRAEAEVERFEIKERTVFAGGKQFGKAGVYERIVGRVYYAVDPDRPQNKNIIDLALAPRDADGKVRFWGDLFLLTPQDPKRASGIALYDVNNRGNKTALRFFNYGGGGNNPQSAAHAGDGFLMEHGITVIWSGWDGELVPGNNRLRLSPPVARRKDGKPIKGMIRCEIVPTSDRKRTVVNWSNHGSYRPTAAALANATLTHREYAGGKRVAIPRDSWELVVSEVSSDSKSQLPNVELILSTGMKRGHIYELIYQGQDPLVHGTCFAGLRDLISAAKHGTGRDNPLRTKSGGLIKRAHGFGVSQSGRFLREFTYWGFNEDEQGRQVFDGIIPHVSGSGLGSFNHRFAQPTRHVTQHDHHDYPADRFPFAYDTQTDPLSKQTEGILQRALESKTCPKVFHTQSEAEYWTRSGSLSHTDPLGQRDAPVPAQVRIYLFGGTQHGPGSFPPRHGSGQNYSNTADYRPFLRALLLRLDEWCGQDKQPPASVYPRISKGTLVDWRQTATGFPKIPGVNYPQIIQQPDFFDYGPRWLSERIIDRQPPGSHGSYKVLVPKCDADGNAVACLSPPEVRVPLGTYTGWNLRSKAAGAEGELVSLTGSFIPFAKDELTRKKKSDPRRSVASRYVSPDAYARQLRAACQPLVKAGYLLAGDVESIVTKHRARFPK